MSNNSRYTELPFEYWVENRKLSSLSLSFLDAHNYTMGSPRLANGEFSKELESRDVIGLYTLNRINPNYTK